MMKLKTTLLAALNLGLLAAARADIIVPTSWKQSNSFNLLRLASNLSNTTGMNAGGTVLYNLDGSQAGEPTSANNIEWMTSSKSVNRAAAMTAGKVWIVADLGATHNLSSIHLWNFIWDNTAGTPATHLNDRGVSQFDILVRSVDADTDNGTAGGVPINLDNPNDDATNALDNDAVFALGTTNPWTVALENQSLAQAPNDDTYTGQTFSLAGQTARLIAIRVDSHYGNTGGIGLGKVRIEGATGVDTTPPSLVVRTPADDAAHVVTSSNLAATFNEVIVAGTGAITIKRTSDNSVAETFEVASSPRLTWTATQVIIDPTANLTPGAEYYVQIAPTAIKDTANNAYAGIVDPDTTSWSFTTDGTPPTAVSLSPASPVTADPGTRLLLQFSETILAGTGAVTIRKTSDNSLVETIDVTTPGAVAMNGRVVAIVRTVPLAPGEAYYVNVAAGAFQDASGNSTAAITGSAAWAFTTRSAVPLVVENFSSAGTGLGGSSADTFDAAIITAGGSATWGASGGFLANGAVSGTNTAAFLSVGSYINAARNTPAGRFELTMTMSETIGAWNSLGFNPSNAPATNQNFTTSGGLATIIYRGQSGVVAPAVIGEVDMFGGTNNTNVVDGPDGNTGFHTFTVTLDLTPAGGYDGVANFGTVHWSDNGAPLGSYTYTVSRDFGSILITQAATGTINALALYQTVNTGNTYANWIAGFDVGGLIDPDDDGDGDGIDNAVENLLGSNPTVSSPGLTAVSLSGGNLSFRHTRSTTPATDLTGSYEWSSDLLTWHASGVTAGGTTVTFGAPAVITPGTPELVEVTASITGSASRVFARFKVSRN